MNGKIGLLVGILMLTWIYGLPADSVHSNGDFLSKPNKEKAQFNRILDDQARREYQESINALFLFSPEVMQRKIPRANVQQAFILDTVRRFALPSSKILCVGCYEDTAYYALLALGYDVVGIDPLNDFDLNSFFHLPTTQKESYDVIFSTSVIEHVEEDELFLQQISQLLAPKGIGVLTCDFKDDWKPGNYVFSGNFRFYTQESMKGRLLPALIDCQLLDEPNWQCKTPDFELGGVQYTFATLVFQKKWKWFSWR